MSKSLTVSDSLLGSHDLTELQRAMLMASLSAPEAGWYVQQLLLTLEEPFSADVWCKAWCKLVERHDVLRTAFDFGPTGQLVQRVQPPISETLPLQVWQEWPEEVTAHEMESFLVADYRRGFAPGKLPFWRWNLFKMPDQHFQLLWTSHHALFDGRSRRLLMQELFTLYDAFAQGQSTELNKPYQIADYLQWRADQSDERSKDYWQERLDGYTLKATFPTRNTNGRSSIGKQAYRTLDGCLSRNQTNRLESVATEVGVTLNTMLQAAWALLLCQHSGSDDVVFGATRACRHSSLEGSESMVGLLINTLPVRAKRMSNVQLVDWLRDLRDQWITTGEHEHTSLGKIQSWTCLSAEESLFQSLVVFEKYRLQESLWRQNSAWRKRKVELQAITPYPLVLSGICEADLSLEISYDRQQFEDETIERLLVQLKHLLVEFSNNPHRTLAEIPLLEKVEQQRLTVDWNDTSTDYPCDKTVHELFEIQADLRPDAVAVVFEDESLTYRELNQRANQLAWHLKSLGVEKGDFVGFGVERRFEMIIGLLGILKTGATYLPLAAEYPNDRLHYMLRDGGADILVAWGEVGGRLAGQVKHVVDLETDWVHGQSTCNLDVDITADDLAYVMYTSGTTGKPKGVMIRHRSIARLVFGVDYAEFSADETVLQVATISFDASTFELWAALLHGAKLILAPAEPTDLGQWSQLISRHQVSTLFLTTALFNRLIETLPKAIQGVRQILTGGEPISVHHVRSFLPYLRSDQLLANVYGPTECTAFACCYPIPHDLEKDVCSLPIGRPIGNTQAYVLDPDLRPVPIGARGELYLGGDGLAKGYWNRPELTAEKFIENPFGKTASDRLYRTGDQVRWLNDGNLEFLGRLDDQIKIRGYRIELNGIAAVLREQTGVADAVVDLWKDLAGNPQLIAYFVPADTAETTELEIQQKMEPLLPRYMLPVAYVPLPSLPLTINGKVDRRALPKPRFTRALLKASPVSARNALEEQLIEIWSDLFPEQSIGVEDEFVMLGGHSLLAMQLVFYIRQELNYEVSVADIFSCRTISQLAQHLSSQDANQNDVRLAKPGAVPESDSSPLLFSQMSCWDVHHQCPGLRPPNTSRAYRLKGDLRIDKLHEAIDLLLARHESLRTNIREVDGTPRQFVSAAKTTAFPCVDLRHFSGKIRKAEVRRLFDAEAVHSFDIERDLLLKATLLKLHDDEHVLVLTIHHIVMDAKSLAILTRDLAELYDALVIGRPADLPDLPLQPSDFAAWEREQLKHNHLQQSILYWRQHLSDLPLENETPPLDELVQMGGWDCLRHRMDVPANTRELLQELSVQEGCTFSVAVFAAMNVFQYFMTGREVSFVGMPLGARVHPESENLIGCFRKRVVLRTRVSKELSFRQLLQRSCRSMMEAYAHLDVSQEVACPDRGIRHPGHWTRIGFNINFIPGANVDLKLGQLDVTSIDRSKEYSFVPRNLHVVDRPEATTLILKLYENQFSQAEVNAMLERFVAVLDCFAENPDSPLQLKKSEIVS
ncbi:MAG: amino acid adenylation domain-containing protein [Pirellulaceae bacterium]|nr:amino acid adenylation domain-containing protein [Pirellulaceae bacterium]